MNVCDRTVVVRQRNYSEDVTPLFSKRNLNSELNRDKIRTSRRKSRLNEAPTFLDFTDLVEVLSLLPGKTRMSTYFLPRRDSERVCGNKGTTTRIYWGHRSSHPFLGKTKDRN